MQVRVKLHRNFGLQPRGSHYAAHSGALSEIKTTKLGFRVRKQTCAQPTVASAKIYVAATHLEGMQELGDMLEGLAPLAQDTAAVHTMTIIEEQTPEGEKASLAPASAPRNAQRQTLFFQAVPPFTQATVSAPEQQVFHLNADEISCHAGIHSV